MRSTRAHSAKPGGRRGGPLGGGFIAAVALVLTAPTTTYAQTAKKPAGHINIGVHVSLAPTWFDPAETAGIITPYLVMFAMHDAMAKPMPHAYPAPSLATEWSMAADGLSYDFTLRQGVKFHDGAPLTVNDVKFSFERYRGNGHALMKSRVSAVEVTAPDKIRFRLKEPWPDFLTYYNNATGAGWIVPKAYVEKVGEDAYKKAPIGAGPYKYVSFTPGVELVMEAFEGYWRKTPSIKRITFKVIPDEATRLVALKRGEIDIAYSLRGELAAEVERAPGLTLRPTVGNAPYWLYYPEQWDPKSPWHDKRVRLAARYAIDYDTINKALTLGHSHITGSFIPENFEFYKKLDRPHRDLAKARALMAEAGFPNGFDAGFYTCDASYANLGETVLNNLAEIGIKAKLRPLERAAFFKGYAEKRFKGIVQAASGAFGNAATRFETFVVSGGTYSHGGYPEIDELFPVQAKELDLAKRTATLHKMQDLLHERAMFTPIWQLAFIIATGPRVDQSGIGLIRNFVYTSPYEDMTLKGN